MRMADSEHERQGVSLLRDVYASVTFLTRFPAPPWPAAGARRLAQAMWAFPLAGVLVAAVAGAAYAVCDAVGLPPALSALAAVATGALATGALHEDGLADFADGVGGGATPERRLEIMSDSGIGTYGALALAVSVAGRAAALAAIADAAAVLGALAAAAAASRGLLPLVAASLDPARADGLGHGAGRPTAPVWAAALAIAAAVALVAAPGGAVRCLVAAAAGALAVGLVARRALGGHTGDVLGAAQQAAELLALALIAGVMTQSG